MASGREPKIAVKAVVAALSDGVDLAIAADALYIGVAGALKINCLDGTTVVFPNVAAGRLDIGATRVWTTGTAATGIVALYFNS